jgi:DNA-binding PadR family transcriptional regulator
LNIPFGGNSLSTRLVILGFLRGRPQYGYEIKQMIEQVMGDWTNIAFGSIYFALKTLAKDGFAEKVGTEQEGGRPSRTIYQITDAGQQEFMRLLREVWNSVERQSFAFDIGVSFMAALPIEEVKGGLRTRIAHLEQTLAFLRQHQAEELADGEHVPTHLTSAVFDHHRRHFQAELEWARELLRNVEQGVYDAELAWMRGMFAGASEEVQSR